MFIQNNFLKNWKPGFQNLELFRHPSDDPSHSLVTILPTILAASSGLLSCDSWNFGLIKRPLLAKSSRWWHRVASGRFTPRAAAELE